MNINEQTLSRNLNQLFGSTQVCSERVSLVHPVMFEMDGQQS